MFNIWLKIATMLLFSTFLVCVGLVITQKFFKDSAKKSPFECGFNPRCNSRLPFSLQFFLVAMIFVIFDVELILLFPFLIGSFEFWQIFVYILFMGFLGLLSVGLVVEWNQQMLNWLI